MRLLAGYSFSWSKLTTVRASGPEMGCLHNMLVNFLQPMSKCYKAKCNVNNNVMLNIQQYITYKAKLLQRSPAHFNLSQCANLNTRLYTHRPKMCFYVVSSALIIGDVLRL